MDIVYINNGGVSGRDAWRWVEGFKRRVDIVLCIGKVSETLCHIYVYSTDTVSFYS